jgi:hypothetical protein
MTICYWDDILIVRKLITECRCLNTLKNCLDQVLVEYNVTQNLA